MSVHHEGKSYSDIGRVLDLNDPPVWRGPMVMGALGKLVNGTAWGVREPLDVLYVDMPPVGTTKHFRQRHVIQRIVNPRFLS